MPLSLGGPGLARLIGHDDAIADRIAHAVEKAAAAMNMAPALRMRAFPVAAHVEELGPFLVALRCRIARSGNMCFAGIAEFALGSWAAPRTGDQQHQCATAAAAASSI